MSATSTRPAHATPASVEMEGSGVSEVGVALPNVVVAPASVPAPTSAAELLVHGPVAKGRHPLRRFLFDLAAGAAVMLALHLFVVQVSIVKGHSMEPSLWDGDRLVVDRISYSMVDVSRFDLIVLRYPVDPDVDFVKRVVGLPGDILAIEDGELFVNGAQFPMPCDIRHDHAHMDPVQVPEASYFVLGDNRPISCDSREFDVVPAAYVKGKVRARFWPMSRFSLF